MTQTAEEYLKDRKEQINKDIEEHKEIDKYFSKPLSYDRFYSDRATNLKKRQKVLLPLKILKAQLEGISITEKALSLKEQEVVEKIRRFIKC